MRSKSVRNWDRWYTEYLTTLREMQAINRKQPRHVKQRGPQIEEIVLVVQENLPRGSWCYDKIVVEIVEMNEYSKPRLAKIKAKKAIQKISRVTDDSGGFLLSTLCPHINVIMIIMITALFLGPPANALSSISCEGSALHVLPPNVTFQLCIQSTCKYFANNLTNFTFLLPATATNGVVAVSMSYFSGNKYTKLQKNCSLPHVCDISRIFMSKHLLGNPHCWPTEAIASIGLLLYLMIAAITLSVKFMLALNSSHSGATVTSSELDKVNKSSHSTVATRKNDEMVNIQLQSFRPLPHSRPSVITAIAVIVCACMNK
ncbi:unnamed protein product [Haemonchus placei]|uniref:DUF5641 domain-containing protein n=1 Tax=Haemonchus placei TaxID=6290 RepID=A0A0N4WG64_HAEPC|nr:unnamed protein product [Haemonchus placei]